MQVESVNPNSTRDPSRNPATTEPNEQFGQQLDKAINEIDDAPARGEWTESRDRAVQNDRATTDSQDPPVSPDVPSPPGSPSQPSQPSQNVPDNAAAGPDSPAVDVSAPAGQLEKLPGEISIEAMAPLSTARQTVHEPPPRTIDPPEPPEPSEPAVPSVVEPTVAVAADSHAAREKSGDPLMVPPPAGVANPVAAIVPSAAAIVPSAAAIVPSAAAIVPSAAAIVPPAAAIVPSAAAIVPPAAAIVPAATAANTVPAPAMGSDVNSSGAASVMPDGADNSAGGRRAEQSRSLERYLADRPGQAIAAQPAMPAAGLGQQSVNSMLGFAVGSAAPDQPAKAIGRHALLQGIAPGGGSKPAPAGATAQAVASAALPIADPIVDVSTSVAPIAGTQASTGQTAATMMAPPQGTAGQPVAQQVAVQIARARDQGVDRIRIQLDPPELGRIDVRLEVSHDGRAQVVISADRSETLDLLRRDALALERALAEAGLDTDADSLSFSRHDDPGDDGDLAGTSDDGVDDDSDAAGRPGEVPQIAWVSADGALDIRV